MVDSEKSIFFLKHGCLRAAMPPTQSRERRRPVKQSRDRDGAVLLCLVSPIARNFGVPTSARGISPDHTAVNFVIRW